MLTTFPPVLGEFETLAQVLSGRSIARYGDGELKLANGSPGIKSQRGRHGLMTRLAEILAGHAGQCLVGLPNLYSETPKQEFWKKFEQYKFLLAEQPYVSAFITRPDSAPWINTPEYWAQLESLWVGQEVTLVRGSMKSLTSEDLMGAGKVTEIVAPRQHAWDDYDELITRIRKGKPKRALLCLGPTATVMAVDLCALGVHAVDLGHVGMFLRKYRRGEPMWVSEEEKAVDRQAV